VKCFKCGGLGPFDNDCKGTTVNCYKCGKGGHKSYECKRAKVVCYNCGEARHISTKYIKPKKEMSSGEVFGLNAEEVEESYINTFILFI